MSTKKEATTASKSKSTAILLAIFFGFFSWFYTYRDDRWKFWLNFVICVVTLGLWFPIGWIWCIVDAARRPRSFYVGAKKLKRHQKITFWSIFSVSIVLLVGLAVAGFVAYVNEQNKINAAEILRQQQLAADPIGTEGVYMALNSSRSGSGAPALSQLNNLQTAASQYCNDMSASNYFDYRNPTTGKEANSYITDNQGSYYFKTYVSSIFTGTDTETSTEIVKRAVGRQATNLTNPAYNSVGVAMCNAPTPPTKFFVVMLGEKADQPRSQVNVYNNSTPIYTPPVHCYSNELLGTIHTTCY